MPHIGEEQVRTTIVSSGSKIQSVERAAEILAFFTVARPQLTLSEISARLGLSKATAHRYATVLRRVNLLRYDQASGMYALGPQILTLSAAARAALPIITVAGPFMEELVREVNETVVLSVWDSETPIVVRTDDNADRTHRISIRTGSRLSPVDSAQGRVFCAFLPEGELPWLSQMLATSEVFRSEIRETREYGIAFNTPELTGIRSIAAPVMHAERIVAVLAVVGTIVSVPGERDSLTALMLQKMARRLSEQFGDAPGA